jgi:hypothetical protein
MISTQCKGTGYMTSTIDLSNEAHIAADVIHTPVEKYWETYQFVYQLYTLSDRAIRPHTTV